MILRSRILLPISQPPIDNGAVVISGDRLAAIGQWDSLAAPSAEPVIDLADHVILPGLVNAHCHLDYTDMAGLIAPPRSFTNWIHDITALKSNWADAQFARSWLRGAEMLLRSGTTTVANIESMPWLAASLGAQTPLRLLSFLELIGIRKETSPAEILRDVIDQVEPDAQRSGRIGLSPHAPYSTTPRLLQLSARYARRRKWRMTIHLAESEDEFRMFAEASGPLYDWLKNTRDMTDCGRRSPVQSLARLGILGEDLLAAHVNYLQQDDDRILSRHGASVVHCPRSHDYFQHKSFPEAELNAAGVNICLGSDSLATANSETGLPLELSMFAEMQALASARPGLSPQTIVQMATTNGSLSLGLKGKVGELSPTAWADLIAIPYSGDLDGACEAVITHSGPVSASMIAGQWAIKPMFL